MAAPPAETCADCGKTISGRLRANVWNNEIILCTDCWHARDMRRAAWESGQNDLVRPASPAQIKYATDLGLSFPPDLTWQEMHDVLSRCLSFEDDPLAPDWLKTFAATMGVNMVTRMTGYRQLYAMVWGTLINRGHDPTLVAWFVLNVARHRDRQYHRDATKCNITQEQLTDIAFKMAEDLGYAVSTHRMRDYVEMHAVPLSGGGEVKLARCGDGDDEDSCYRCAVELALMVGIDLRG